MKFRSKSIYFFVGLGLIALSLFSQTIFAHGMSEADKMVIINGGNLIYMWIGATHMLSGYDHLAFVFGIIFFLSNFRDIVKYISGFTIGHSITLIYATFNGIQLNYYLIDAVIALSVCYIAFANLDGFRKYLNVDSPNMMFMIVGLGLVHGFGLSTRLQELPLSTDNLLQNIISFNIGIELGQITALAIMLGIIAAWRNKASFNIFSLIANYSLVIAGSLLFLMQMHDYAHNGEISSAAIAGEPEMVQSDQDFIPMDTIKVAIPARGDIEYKIMIVKNEKIQYRWKSDKAELFYDFHGDPKGGTPDSFQSYQKGTTIESSGVFIAPFDGKHGWYWQNKNNFPVELILEIKGIYTLIQEKKITKAVYSK
ncbi:MAG: HupE/UreJ family protein [Mariprofundales bacterium]